MPCSVPIRSAMSRPWRILSWIEASLRLNARPTTDSDRPLYHWFHRGRIRRGSYAIVPELVTAIRTFIGGWNERLPPIHLDPDGRRDPAARP